MMLKFERAATKSAVRWKTVIVVVIFGREIGFSHSPASVPFKQA
jgi:hypothetical protein